MTKKKPIKALSQAELDQLLKVLFPWGYAKVNGTRYIGPVPSRLGYNIMALETSEGWSEPDVIFSLVIIKVLDDTINDKALLGFYLGFMARAFSEYICYDDKFEPDGMDVLDFKRRDTENYVAFGVNCTLYSKVL